MGADRMHAFENVRMFQSRFFRDKYLKDIEVFRYIEINEVPGDEDRSLRDMREAMITSEDFSAAFFIGGMDGVEREYDCLKRLQGDVPRFPVATTGAAAQILWPREVDTLFGIDPDVREIRRAQLEKLRVKTSYIGLFTELLNDPHPKGQIHARL